MWLLATVKAGSSMLRRILKSMFANNVLNYHSFILHIYHLAARRTQITTYINTSLLHIITFRLANRVTDSLFIKNATLSANK